MYRVLTFLSVVSLMLFAACKQESPAQSTTANVPAAASVAPSVAGSVAPSTAPSLAASVAPSTATSTGSVSPTVVPTVVIPPAPVPSVVNGKQAKSEQKPLPPDLWQRMTRPLSLEEINKLPPEVRDTILRAQGRLPASPSPSPKKK